MSRIRIKKPTERSLYQEGYDAGFAEGMEAGARNEEFMIRNLRAELAEERESNKALEATNKTLQEMNDRLLKDRFTRGAMGAISNRLTKGKAATPTDDHISPDFIVHAIVQLRQCGRLTAWESSFLDSIEKRAERGIPLSFGQKESWMKILDKYYWHGLWPAPIQQG